VCSLDGTPELLTGGNTNIVERVGDTVRRSGGPWTPTVHALLDHLRARRIDWLPRPLGVDEDGRELLTFLPGTVPQYPMPDWVWADEQLVTAGRKLRAFHDASVGFDQSGPWQMPPHEPPEVICHNDFAPYNFVFDDSHRLVGVIDCDMASPGPRVWDVAYLAYRLVPLTSSANVDGLLSSVDERARRLVLLTDAYGALDPRSVLTTTVDRLLELAASTAARAEAGATQVVEHVQIYVDDAGWLAEQLERLAGQDG
jgi:Phosphotransferase enzyme family